MRMLRHIGGLDPRRPVRPWLKRVAANLAVDHLRRRWRDVSEDAVLARPDETARSDAYGEALGLLRRLPPLVRALVWLNQMEGWSHPELARRFGRSESWSKSIVHRALAQLRDHVAKEHRNAE